MGTTVPRTCRASRLRHVARPGRVRGVAQRAERAHAPGVRARRARVRGVVRAGRLPRRRPTSTIGPCAATSPTSRPAGFARASIARKAASVRAYVRYLRRRGVLDRDVAAAVQAPKGARRLPRMPKAAEATALLDDVGRDAADPDDPRGAARPRRPRAALRRRPAGQRVLRPRRRRRRPQAGDRHRRSARAPRSAGSRSASPHCDAVDALSVTAGRPGLLTRPGADERPVPQRPRAGA